MEHYAIDDQCTAIRRATTRYWAKGFGKYPQLLHYIQGCAEHGYTGGIAMFGATLDVVKKYLLEAVSLCYTLINMCMSMRGIQKSGSRTVTSAVRGIFQRDGKVRAEAMSLILHS